MPRLKPIELSPEEEARAEGMLLRMWEKKSGVLSWGINNAAVLNRIEHLRRNGWVKEVKIKREKGAPAPVSFNKTMKLTVEGEDHAAAIFLSVFGVSRLAMSVREVQALIGNRNFPLVYTNALDVANAERRFQDPEVPEARPIAPPQHKIHKLRD